MLRPQQIKMCNFCPCTIPVHNSHCWFGAGFCARDSDTVAQSENIIIDWWPLAGVYIMHLMQIEQLWRTCMPVIPHVQDACLFNRRSARAAGLSTRLSLPAADCTSLPAASGGPSCHHISWCQYMVLVHSVSTWCQYMVPVHGASTRCRCRCTVDISFSSGSFVYPGRGVYKRSLWCGDGVDQNSLVLHTLHSCRSNYLTTAAQGDSSLSLYLFLSVSLCLCLFLFLSISFCLYLSLSLCLYLSASLSSLCMSIPLVYWLGCGLGYGLRYGLELKWGLGG